MQYQAVTNNVKLFSLVEFYFTYRGVTTDFQPGEHWLEIEDGATFDTDASSVSFAYAKPLLMRRPAFDTTWVQGVNYYIGDIKLEPVSNNLCICIVNHTSSDHMIIDYVTGYWQLLNGQLGEICAFNYNCPDGYTQETGSLKYLLGTGHPEFMLLYLYLASQEYPARTIDYLYHYTGSDYDIYLPDLKGFYIAGAGTNDSYADSTLDLRTYYPYTVQTHNHTVTETAHGHTFTGTAHNHGVTESAHGHTFTGTEHGHSVTDPGHVHAIQYYNASGSTRNNLGYEYSLGLSSTNFCVTATTGLTVNNATATGSNATATTGLTVNNATATGTNSTTSTGLTVNNATATGTNATATTGLTVNNTTANRITRPYTYGVNFCIRR